MKSCWLKLCWTMAVIIVVSLLEEHILCNEPNITYLFTGKFVVIVEHGVMFSGNRRKW